MAVEFFQRDDGRIEIRVDGYVIWCGRDRDAARTIYKQANGISDPAEGDLNGAVEVMRRSR